MDSYLRQFAFDFIRSVAPSLTSEIVKAAVKKPSTQAAAAPWHRDPTGVLGIWNGSRVRGRAVGL